MFEQFLEEVKVFNEENTYKCYKKALSYFDEPPTKEGVIKFMEAESLSINTKKDYLTIWIRASLSLGIEVDKGIIQTVKGIKRTERYTPFATKNEVESLLACTNNLMLKSVIGLMAYGGLRISEVVGLIYNDIHLDEEQPYLVVRNTKNHTDRKVLVNEKLLNILNRYLDDGETKVGEWLFTSYRRKKGLLDYRPYNKVYIQNKIKELCVGLGFENLSCHSFRRYFATSVYNESKDMRLTAYACGHKAIATTMRYIGVDESKLLETMNRI